MPGFFRDNVKKSRQKNNTDMEGKTTTLTVSGEKTIAKFMELMGDSFPEPTYKHSTFIEYEGVESHPLLPKMCIVMGMLPVGYCYFATQ